MTIKYDIKNILLRRKIMQLIRKLMKKTFILIALLGITIGGIVKHEIDDLKSTINRLTIENGKLLAHKAFIKKSLKKRKNRLVKRSLKKAKRKLAKAPSSMIPIIGTATVIGFTTYEINELCEEAKENDKFQISLFGDDNETISDEQKALCDYDKDAVERIVQQEFVELKNDIDSGTKILQQTIDEQKKDIEKAYTELLSSSTKIIDEQSENVQKTYHEFIDEPSKIMELF